MIKLNFMKRLVILFSLCLLCASITAQSVKNVVNNLSSTVDSHSEQINDIKNDVVAINDKIENIDYALCHQNELIVHEHNAISNSMSSIAILLTAVSILIAFGGLILGWFINNRAKTMQELLAQAEDVKKRMSQTKNDIVDINDSIHNDIEKLYQKLRREETKTLLKRLVYEPQDIDNIINLLLSRKLEDDDFKLLLAAYRNYKNESVSNTNISYDDANIDLLENNKHNYMLLFFQHFCGQASLHELTHEDLVGYFEGAIKCAFKKDINNSTLSLVACMNKADNVYDVKELLIKYITALYKSKFNSYEEPYKIIVTKYHDKKTLQQIWSELVMSNIIIPILGKLLIELFKDEDELFVKAIQTKLEPLNN